MDVRITWALPPDILITDEFDVFYKEADINNLNNWIKVNPTPLPSTTSFYDITGLNFGTIYKFGVAKSCVGTGSILDQIIYSAIGCPIVSIYQGAPLLQGPRTSGTLFYSLYYQDAANIDSAKISIFDTTIAPSFPVDCPTPTAAVIGRTFFQTVDSCSNILATNCGEQTLDFLSGVSTSGVGYFGLDSASFANPCNGTATDPILFKFADTFKFKIDTELGLGGNPVIPDFQYIDGVCTTEATANEFNLALIPIDYQRTSPAICWDILTGLVSITVEDGTAQTVIEDYNIEYFTLNNPGTEILRLVDNAGIPVTGNTALYPLYCPVTYTPALNLAQLSDDMGFSFFINNPAPALIYTAANLSFAGNTTAQALTSIAAIITANTAYPATYVNISGTDYIKIVVPGNTIISADLLITGPNLLYSELPDIVQVAPAVNQGGIQDGFVYTTPSGDFLYGARGTNSATCKIEVTDISNGTTSPGITTEYGHPIDFSVTQMVLVDQPPPATVYDIRTFSEDFGIHGLNQAIVDNPILWNDGYVYVPGGLDGFDLEVYDSTLALVDTLVGVSTVPIRLVEIDQFTGHIFTVGDQYLPNTPFGGTYITTVINHSAIGVHVIVGTGTRVGENEVYEGTITGRYFGTVQSVSAINNSITVAGAPWNPNPPNFSWNGYRVEILTGAMAGKQVKLWTYYNGPTPPPLQLNIPNDTNTIYIDTSLPNPLFDITQVLPGDTFAIMEPFYEGNGFTDLNATWIANEWVGYNVTITSGGSRGIFALVQQNTATSLGIEGYAVNYGWVNNLNTFNNNLSYGTKYIIYKINAGQLKWNSITGNFYYSHGLGQIAEFDNTGAWLSTAILVEPDGITQAIGSFQFALDSNGIAYAICRDIQNTEAGGVTSSTNSRNIYKLDTTSMIPIAAIDGSSRWMDFISGNISLKEPGPVLLYFTSQETRELIEYNVSSDTLIVTPIPAVYEKSSAQELISGAVILDNDRFIIMNRLNNFWVPNRPTDYLFSNLFVYNYTTNVIEQVLVGANSAAYSGTPANWNNGSYGEMFAEYNGQKSYGMGGLSISTRGGNTIYWKQAPEMINNFRSVMTAEIGVAQIWGNRFGAENIIRIWNIQSDGSLVPSVRNHYVHGKGTGRSLLFPPNYFKYSSVVGLLAASNPGRRIDRINTQTLTGAYNGIYYPFYTITTSKIAIDPTVTSPGLFFPIFFDIDPSGTMYVFGPNGAGNQSIAKSYNSSVLLGTSNTPTAVATIADGVNPGLYNPSTYPPIYDVASNTIYKMGNLTPNGPPPANVPGDRIISVMDATTFATVDTINLTAANAVPGQGTGIFNTPVSYSPSLNRYLYFGAGGTNPNILTMIDPSNNTVAFTGNINILYNFKRSPIITGVNHGWIVPYDRGFFLDYYVGITDKWTYIVPTDITYSGDTHNKLQIYVEGNLIATDDAYNITTTATTFGQWKVTTALPSPGDNVVYWNNIPGTGNIAINPNETIEFTQFSMDNPLVAVENLTQGDLYEITDPLYINANTLPTFNTLNSVPFFAIKADSVNLFNGDVLQFTFENSADLSCPFINTVTINF